VRGPHEIQQRKTIINQVVLRGVQALHVSQRPIPLLAPGRRNPVVEFDSDPTIELVEVEGVQSVLKSIGLGPQALNRFVAVASLVCMTLTAGSLNEPK